MHTDCFSGAHMIHAVVSCISLVVFTGLALIFTMADMELNPMTQISFLAVSHSKCAVLHSLVVYIRGWLAVGALHCF